MFPDCSWRKNIVDGIIGVDLEKYSFWMSIASLGGPRVRSDSTWLLVWAWGLNYGWSMASLKMLSNGLQYQSVWIGTGHHSSIHLFDNALEASAWCLV